MTAQFYNHTLKVNSNYIITIPTLWREYLEFRGENPLHIAMDSQSQSMILRGSPTEMCRLKCRMTTNGKMTLYKYFRSSLRLCAGDYVNLQLDIANQQIIVTKLATTEMEKA